MIKFEDIHPGDLLSFTGWMDEKDIVLVLTVTKRNQFGQAEFTMWSSQNKKIEYEIFTKSNFRCYTKLS